MHGMTKRKKKTDTLLSDTDHIAFNINTTWTTILCVRQMSAMSEVIKLVKPFTSAITLLNKSGK